MYLCICAERVSVRGCLGRVAVDPVSPNWWVALVVTHLALGMDPGTRSTLLLVIWGISFVNAEKVKVFSLQSCLGSQVPGRCIMSLSQFAAAAYFFLNDITITNPPEFEFVKEFTEEYLDSAEFRANKQFFGTNSCEL